VPEESQSAAQSWRTLKKGGGSYFHRSRNIPASGDLDENAETETED
jgi:hypothetical protein